MSTSANAPGEPGRDRGDAADPNRDPAEDPLAGAGAGDEDSTGAGSTTGADSAGADSTAGGTGAGSGSDDSTAADSTAGAGSAATPRRKSADAGKDVTKKVKQEARASEAAVKGKPGPKKSGSGAAKSAEPGLFGRIVLFIRQVIAEIRKVVTPTRQELITFSVVVIVFILVMMAYVGVLDFGIGRLVLWVFGN